MVRDTGARAKLGVDSRSSSTRSSGSDDDDDLENQNGCILASCAYFGADDVVCAYI
jgi:AICAR transformylase/IMP cyclohydrolase PurH